MCSTCLCFSDKIISYLQAIFRCVSCPTTALLEEVSIWTGDWRVVICHLEDGSVHRSRPGHSTCKEPDVNLFPLLNILVHFFFFASSFIEILFTYHTNHPFKMYNPLVLAYSELYNHHLSQF